VKESLKGKMQSTLRPESVLTKLQRVAEISGKAPEMVWTTLAYNIDILLLKEAYRLTRKNGAAGVDGQTAIGYEENLEENLQIYWTDLNPALIEHRRSVGPTCPKGTERKCGPSAYPPLRTKCFKERWLWC
jgi:hypothetical protein